VTEPREVESLAVQLDLAMLCARVPRARHYDPSLPRNLGRFEHQTDARDTYTSEWCAGSRVIDRRRRSG
jgi:hypothetical protein